MPGVVPSLITDQASLSPRCGSRTVQETFTLKDDLSKARRAHNFKMGYELLRYQPQYPGFMPNYGGVILKQRPTLRDNWQDLGGDRFNQGNQNSMINCGPTVLNYGNDCFTYVPAFSLGNNGATVWNNQRLIAASAAIYKEITLKERARLQIRLDIQNPFKWYNWGGPSTSLNVQTAANALTFGKINPGSNGETNTGTAGYGGTPLLNLTFAVKW
jgi:hypothetical protein